MAMLTYEVISYMYGKQYDFKVFSDFLSAQSYFDKLKKDDFHIQMVKHEGDKRKIVFEKMARNRKRY